MRNFQKDIADIFTYIMLDYPLYGYILNNIIRKSCDAIPTACIARFKDNPILEMRFNEEFFYEELVSDELKMGVTIHELLHVILLHPFRAEEFPDARLCNIAMDMVINQFIAKDWLPEGCVDIDDYPHFNLLKDKDTDYYYSKLAEEMEKINKMKSQGGQSQSGSGEGDNDSDGNGDSDGKSGEGSDKDSQKGMNSSQKKLDNMMKEPIDHAWDELTKGMSGEEKDMLRNTIEKQIEEAVNQVKMSGDADSWGNLPGGLRQHLDKFMDKIKPFVSWRRMFHGKVGNAQSTLLKTTYKKRSRRYGTTPAPKIKRKKKLLLAIDTSASVDIESLQLFFNEIYAIWKTGAQIKIIECDTEIGNVYDYKGKTPDGITGRGGTYFDPPFDWCNKNWRDCDMLIYFTDGECSPPSIKLKNPHTRQMWLVCKTGYPTPENMKEQGFKGTIIKMN